MAVKQSSRLKHAVRDGEPGALDEAITVEAAAAEKLDAKDQADEAREDAETAARQAENFRQAARDLGCDEDEDRFADRIRTLAAAPPVPAQKPPSKTKR